MAAMIAKRGLYALAGVVILLGGGWLGWQYHPNHGSAPQASIVSKQPVPNRDKLIDEVLMATGLNRQLEQLPEQVRAGMEAVPGNEKLPPAVTEAIGKIVGDSFAEQHLHDQVLDRLKANFDQKRLQAILDDFSSPLVKRMVAMEVKANTPQEQMDFIQELSSKPLSQERVTAIQELDLTTHASKLDTEITLASIKAMARGLMGNNKEALAELDQSLEEQRISIEAKLHQAMLINMAFIYRDASDEDLSAYAKIYGAAHNQWLSNIVTGALSDGIQNASKKIGERLEAMMKNNDQPSPAVAGSGLQAAN